RVRGNFRPGWKRQELQKEPQPSPRKRGEGACHGSGPSTPIPPLARRARLYQERNGGNRAGSKAERSTERARPSTISSAIASPVAGALRIPQTLWPVAM